MGVRPGGGGIIGIELVGVVVYSTSWWSFFADRCSVSLELSSSSLFLCFRFRCCCWWFSFDSLAGDSTFIFFARGDEFVDLVSFVFWLLSDDDIMKSTEKLLFFTIGCFNVAEDSIVHK